MFYHSFYTIRFESDRCIIGEEGFLHLKIDSVSGSIKNLVFPVFWIETSPKMGPVSNESEIS